MWQGQRGFQIIELILACGIVVMVAGWAVTSVAGLRMSYRLASAESLLVGELNRARQMAISSGLPIQILWPSEKRFSMGSKDGPSIDQELPDGVLLVAQPARPITFYGRGSAAPAGSFTLANPAGETRIIVAISGRVRSERRP